MTRPRRHRRPPLRRRLALTASAAVAGVALAVCAGAYAVTTYTLRRQFDLQLTQAATLAVQQYAREGPGVQAGQCRYLAAPACAQLVPERAADDPRDGFLLPVTPAVRQVAAGRRAPYYSVASVAGHPVRVLTTPARKGLATQVALRSDGVMRAERQVAGLLAVIGGAGVPVAALLGYWVSRSGLAPVSRLTSTAERITATRDPGLRIEVPGGPRGREDELTRLAVTINTMLDALEESVTAQRRLVADASHELRTPLTALRANAEILLRTDELTPRQRERATAALTRQLREVTTLVNDLIDLARDEEPHQALELVQPTALLEHTVAAARDHWPQVTFALDIDPAAAAAMTAAVPSRLTRLFSNLLDNAAKFSPAGGRVEVAARTAPADGGLEITVRDHGPGVDAADLPHVFDRFYRSRTARALPGSGLGLAMARQIAQTHRAELTAHQAPGGGALFRLTLPVDPRFTD
ncbi:HAMP domain-containing sensor histidine kinase [Streptomyces gibsoniae]|uniref:histidine kinase n=1 Tax=Streptomyces gibsoniae TaxID=3075529 RepID=A0ABU2TMC9_9ACTN|nr:HAMP domain-containing sensor histidine kinase [Streptomyces sp. DSM 41699]MDT0462095.1 HAMP domain-containing sensor histidine kinase [Streptomyces sp. DSM 41699]